MSSLPGRPLPLWKRLGWLILIWISSVSALAVVAYGLRWFMQLAGLSAK